MSLKNPIQSQSMAQDEHSFGSANYRVVRSDRNDQRSWLENAPICSLLKKHHISHSGMMEANHPFLVSRADPDGTYMMACLEGSGEVLVDGKWETLSSGQACLLPPFVLNRFRCKPRKLWKFCWVRYHESREQTPIISSSTPVMNGYTCAGLHHAFMGLYEEVCTSAENHVMEMWVNLLHQHVLRFAQPRNHDERLVALWREVEKSLEQPWSLEDMAAHAHVSAEHLRRLCQKHMGRSPMQQLTFLRMQKAQRLLNETSEKIETVARMVGYESGFTFSNSFKKWVGWRPSTHRKPLTQG